MGILFLSTPMKERIDRWATSGRATQILLHPSDFLRLSEQKKTAIEQKYNLPVTVLGGTESLKNYIKTSKESSENVEGLISVDPAAELKSLGE
jgi:hypothetical protein|tara:strand:- start:414 stop:692 length:279 start_codon:yes stop_codon:yes gene_type:complete